MDGHQGADLLIRPVEATDDEEMREYQRLCELAERAELPDAVVYTLHDAVTVLTRPSVGSLYRGYAAFEDGRMVGEAMIVCSTEDNLERARVWVWVPPAERNRGVGSALAEFLVPRCRELGDVQNRLVLDAPAGELRGTIVRPADRGHRLGLTLKVQAVREIQEHFPAKRFVSTVNAETNAPMVSVNEALSFTPYAIEDELQRILPYAAP